MREIGFHILLSQISLQEDTSVNESVPLSSSFLPSLLKEWQLFLWPNSHHFGQQRKRPLIFAFLFFLLPLSNSTADDEERRKGGG